MFGHDNGNYLVKESTGIIRNELHLITKTGDDFKSDV